MWLTNGSGEWVLMKGNIEIVASQTKLLCIAKHLEFWLPLSTFKIMWPSIFQVLDLLSATNNKCDFINGYLGS